MFGYLLPSLVVIAFLGVFLPARACDCRGTEREISSAVSAMCAGTGRNKIAGPLAAFFWRVNNPPQTGSPMPLI